MRVNERHARVLEPLQRHEFVNSHQLWRLVRDAWPNEGTFKKVLTRMTHEANNKYGGQLLYRPAIQWATSNRESYDNRNARLAIYGKTSIGDECLKQYGLHDPAYVGAGGTLPHRIFASALGASLEIGAREAGLIIRKVPGDRRIEVAGGMWIPDDAYVLGDGRKEILLLIEVDRATEPDEPHHDRRKRSRSRTKYLKRTLNQAMDYIPSRSHQRDFGISGGAIMLFVSVKPSKVDSGLGYVRQRFGQRCNFMLFHAIPEFGTFSELPRILPMFDVQWQRHGNPSCTLTEFF